MLDKFFKPRSVAIIGASEKKGKVGNALLVNLLDYGYKGKIFPVNPLLEELSGLKVYPSIKTVEDEIDLAVIATPPPTLVATIKDCGDKNIKCAIVISAGFKETGAEGAKLETSLARAAKEYGVRIIGPNCLGVISSENRLNATFSAGAPPAGRIAFLSQSGALCTATLDWAIGGNIGISKFISIGNKIDVAEPELIDHLADDPHTGVILCYIEGLKDGVEFMKAAWRASRKKPLIITKGGKSEAGARAVSSHTGTLAGSHKAFEAAFKQCGIIKAETIGDLFDFALAFSMQPLPEGENLAIITNAGGPAILAADACANLSIQLATFSRETLESLSKQLPPVAAIHNPVDVIGDAKADRYMAAIETVLSDSNVHSLAVLLTPQFMTEVEGTSRVILEASRKHRKPIVASLMGKKSIESSAAMLVEGGVPCYSFPEDCVRAIDALTNYKRIRELPQPDMVHFDVEKDRAETLIKRARQAGRYALTELEAREIIRAYGFALPESRLAETSDEAVGIANSIGYPVVIKVASPDILHKSDVGAVKVGLKNEKEVRDSFLEVILNSKRYMPRAEILGAVVQEMVIGGREFILGISHDDQFGHLIMLGLGGIYVEVLKDVTFRVAPIDARQADSMMAELRSYPLLQGVRGEKPLDVAALKNCMLRLSQLSCDFPQVLEADINPLIVKPSGGGAIALDARISLGEA